MNSSSVQDKGGLVRHAAVFFMGSVLVGILNYLYYPVLARLMEPASFGEVQTLVSLFLQFTIFLNVLGMVTITVITNYADRAAANRVVFELEKLAAYGAFILLGIGLFAGDFLKQQFQFTSALPFTALALALLVSIPLTFRSAYARSQKRFGIASASQIIGAFVKIIFSAMLVAVGFGTFGAIAGIVIAQFVAFLYAARWAGRLGFSLPKGVHYGRLPDLSLVLPELKYAGLVLGGLLSITLLMSMDIVIIKYFFDAQTAGLYAGVATVARIIFFLAAPIAQVLIPLITTKQTMRENRQMLVRSAGLTLAVGLPALAALTLFPEQIVALLMGEPYTAYASLLPSLALAITIISLLNLLCLYFLALRKKMVTLFSAAGFVISFCLMIASHATPHAIVNAMLIGGSLALGATGVYMAATRKGEY